MENKVDVFKALGDNNRLRILSMLNVRELCVCEINAVLKVSMSTISSHLKILRNAGLVTSRKDGRWIIYRLETSNGERAALIRQSLGFIAEEQDIKDDLKKLGTVSPENCSTV
ncbi:transcriptional regulator, ArsR family [Denitrovibrio acetiphilus DSM 12809]|uniref:Transcriptional regulator, ArsR family n=1 Tax=Denitrovibrio acetiphilus (strain DSM 12809 / NBRC 114555 / N2460) TaxID=522772 RepID=D4H6Q7_DENA2|nr:metalloregulator ArsR/SmtB family transcription factor [Denitrovibrio acetiphilus]ADD67773.1 transcriptional regulator, ArsR family [Denitrovibrio acetiphilus DSM 12809]